MAGAKHTPGPWRPEDTNSAKLSKVVVSAQSGANGNTAVIGQCAGPDKEANAVLIAAAPDLYNAIVAMRAGFAVLVGLLDVDGPTTSFDVLVDGRSVGKVTLQELFDQAAITKAEGRC